MTSAEKGRLAGVPVESKVVTNRPLLVPARPVMVIIAGPVDPLKVPKPTVLTQLQSEVSRLKRTS